MRILFFNRFFFPDASATSQMLSDLAFHLAAAGHEVHVVASGAAPQMPQERIRGVTVHRVVSSPAPGSGLVLRAIAYAAYLRAARRAARALVMRGDTVIVKTDPPMLSAAIAPIAAARGARLVAWLQDLFPEIAAEHGVSGMRGAAGRWLRVRRDRSLAAADAIVAIGDIMAARVARLEGVRPERVHVVHNWADGVAITASGDAAELRAEWGLAGRFVVAYSGNLGRVHEFDTILDAASLLRERADVAFVFIGTGPRLPQVRRAALERGLSNVQFRPRQERERLGESMRAADAHLCVLRPGFEGLVHPSKLYGILAAGRPAIFVGSLQGESAAILQRTRAGVAVAAGDAAGLAAAIERLRGDPEARRRMGAQARAALEREYDLPIAMRHWEAILEALAH